MSSAGSGEREIVTEAIEDRSRLPRTVFGTAAVYLGALILIIAGCEELGGGLPGLPRFWYVNRPVWIGLGILMIPIGVAIQAGRTSTKPRWKASIPGRRFQQIKVYTREGCHLCDEAIETLWKPDYASYLPDPEIIDVDQDPDLQSLFGLLVPVIECDGQVRFKGNLDEGLLRRLIEGSSPL